MVFGRFRLVEQDFRTLFVHPIKRPTKCTFFGDAGRWKPIGYWLSPTSCIALSQLLCSQHGRRRAIRDMTPNLRIAPVWIMVRNSSKLPCSRIRRSLIKGLSTTFAGKLQIPGNRGMGALSKPVRTGSPDCDPRRRSSLSRKLTSPTRLPATTNSTNMWRILA